MFTLACAKPEKINTLEFELFQQETGTEPVLYNSMFSDGWEEQFFSDRCEGNSSFPVRDWKHLINRPGVAGAVLQTPLSLIQYLSHPF